MRPTSCSQSGVSPVSSITTLWPGSKSQGQVVRETGEAVRLQKYRWPVWKTAKMLHQHLTFLMVVAVLQLPLQDHHQNLPESWIIISDIALSLSFSRTVCAYSAHWRDTQISKQWKPTYPSDVPVISFCLIISKLFRKMPWRCRAGDILHPWIVCFGIYLVVGDVKWHLVFKQ